MATTPFEPLYPGASLFDIYNDAAVAARGAGLALPGGACNFVDLTPGATGAKCGCRRFWTRQFAGSPGIDQSGWCMCNHHACYHDQGDGRVQEQPMEHTAAGQENERPQTGRDPLSPVMAMPLQAAAAMTGVDFPSFSPDMPLSFIHQQAEDRSGVPPSPHPASWMPDTLAWGDTVQSMPGPPSNSTAPLPPIPSQCLMTSQATSTTSSARARYLRPFAGKGLQTLNTTGTGKSRDWIQAAQPRSRLSSMPQRDDASLKDSFVLVAPDAHAEHTPLSGTATQAEPRVVAAGGAISDEMDRGTLRNLSNTVNVHEQRLDRLETVSFSAGGHDDCLEKNDHLDLRATELENRMEEIEKLVNDNGSVAAHQIDKNDGSSARTVVSFSTTATSRPTHSQDFYSQIQSLQAQVTQLRSSLPSYAHPWEVEVVFLPFPLQKLWQEPHQFKSDLSASCDEWTQLPMTHSAATFRSQSPFFADWAAQEHDKEWLLPRACGDKSVADKRLRSRGLIQNVTFMGPDARSVQMAMNSAFDGVFRSMHLLDRRSTRASPFLGLQSTWVPLRKIHKDSRLRFLSPAEMVTPAIWDAQFLNSVIMRSAEPRLFITHPDAYLQDADAHEAGWTWQRVRELRRVYPEVSESQAVPEADALEDCWSWNEHLDTLPSARTSVSLSQRGQRVSTSLSQPDHPKDVSRRSSTPMVGRGPSPFFKSRRGSRPPHIRTTSVPLAAASRSSPVVSRRPMMPHGHSRRSSPGMRVTSQSAIMKRRQTRSPSHPRFTPRWTASPSPMPLGLHERQVARGITPVAYATPFSNAPLQDFHPMQGGSLSRNANGEKYLEDYQARLDELYDIEIYESGSDGDFDDGDDDDDEISASMELVTHAQPNPDHDSQLQQRQLPEDEPWPGIEDQDRMSDGENIDPHHHAADRRSDASSQPSEYPSTNQVWVGNSDGPAFQIHEDGDGAAPHDA